MKILFVESAQNFGGARKATIQLAKVASDEHYVQILDIYGSCVPFVDACKKSGLSFNVLLPDHDPHYVRSAKGRWSKVWNLITFLPHGWSVAKRLNDFISDGEFDYVCVSGFRPLMFFRMKKPQTKVVFFAHGWYLNKLLNRRERSLLSTMVDKIVCISQATKHALYNDGIARLEQLHVVHNCIDETTTNVAPAEISDSAGCFKILHCAGFTKGKGQHVSLQVARELKNRGVKFKLIFTGIIYQGKESQQYFEYLQKQVEEYELKDEVEFVVGHANVYDYMRAADILLHPSETEGFPLVVMEAQIMMKPVVANAVGGVVDMVLDNYTGFLPTHNNIDEYSDIIEHLASDNQLYDYIATNAYNMARRCFSPKQQKKELQKVFK